MFNASEKGSSCVSSSSTYSKSKIIEILLQKRETRFIKFILTIVYVAFFTLLLINLY